MHLSGDVIWQQPRPTGLQSSLPVFHGPDLDGDKTADVVLVASDNTQVIVFIVWSHVFHCLFLFLHNAHLCLQYTKSVGYVIFIYGY